MPKVLNKHRDNIPNDAIYCGRGSRWGNPFKISASMTRDMVCDAYAEWFVEQDHLIDSLHELRGKDLICFCAPKRCHCDLLLILANSELTNDHTRSYGE